MTTHRHQDSRAKWTTSVTDPDLSGLATKVLVGVEAQARANADAGLRSLIDALAARVAALEGEPVPPEPPDSGPLFQPDVFQPDVFDTR